MLFEQIDIHHVAMPLKTKWRTACSEETAIESVLVRAIGDGVETWAETAPHRGPLYSPEWASGVFMVLRDWLAPMVLGKDVRDGDELSRLLRPVKAHPFAKAALDMAMWGGAAQKANMPLWKLAGGAGSPVTVGADIGVMDTIDDLLGEIQSAVDAGFGRVKLKYRPGWEEEMVAAVRGTFPDLAMHVDCNSAYTLDDLAMLKRLDRFHLAMIEQPLGHDDLVDHAKLQRSIGTPICLDESITSVSRARHAIELKSCKLINLKIGRVGGLTNAITIHDMCREAGVGNWVGSMLESAVAQGYSLALASLPNMVYPSDIFPTQRFYSVDLAIPELVLTGASEIAPPARSGPGFVPDPSRLETMTTEFVSLRI